MSLYTAYINGFFKMGVMPFSYDNKVVLERKGAGEFFVNGFAGHGIMHGPGVGKFVADWVVEGVEPEEIEACRRGL